MPMGAGYGQLQMIPSAPYFSSPCLTPKRRSRNLVGLLCVRESRSKATYQKLLIHRLTKITNSPFIQSACSISGVGIRSNEDGRNREPRTGEVSEEFDS